MRSCESTLEQVLELVSGFVALAGCSNACGGKIYKGTPKHNVAWDSGWGFYAQCTSLTSSAGVVELPDGARSTQPVDATGVDLQSRIHLLLHRRGPPAAQCVLDLPIMIANSADDGSENSQARNVQLVTSLLSRRLYARNRRNFS